MSQISLDAEACLACEAIIVSSSRGGPLSSGSCVDNVSVKVVCSLIDSS